MSGNDREWLKIGVTSCPMPGGYTFVHLAKIWGVERKRIRQSSKLHPSFHANGGATVFTAARMKVDKRRA
jgi:hypothetical protein